MRTRVLIFYRLKEDIDRVVFERRAREIESVLAGRSAAILEYALTRIEQTLGGNAQAPFDYVETLEVTSLSDYQTVPGDPAAEAFLADWDRDVAEYVIVSGPVVSST